MREGLAASMRYYLREQAGLFVRALRAAGRREDAEAVAREALRLDDSPEMRAALDSAGQ